MDTLYEAVELIQTVQRHGNRVHVTGIGKPGHLAGYIASLFSSTGTPTYFLHGTEAVHGSCGQLVKGDVVICISNSGETLEMKSTVTAIKNNGCSIIGVSGNPESWLARESDVHLLAAITVEGGPLNRAPRNSIIAESLVLQELSVLLQADRNISPHEYVLRHPGGALGKLRKENRFMKKNGCIQPDIVGALAACGHGDKILIADANFPLGSKCPQALRVYLGLICGQPTVPDVLSAIQQEINIEAAEVMIPEGGIIPSIFSEFSEKLAGLKLIHHGRKEFYNAAGEPEVKLAINTGEVRTFANLLITVGVS